MTIITRNPTNDCFVLNDSVMRDTCTCDYQYMEIGANYNPYGIPANRVYRAFLSIDLSDITADNLTLATLNLYDRTQSGTLLARRTTSSWSCPTWNNQPTTTSTNEVTFSSTANNWASVDVTQLIKDIINSGTNYGIGIVESSSNCGSPAFNSIEIGSNKPYFEFTIEESTYTLSGTVYNNDNIPIKNATVTINDIELLTNQDGYYEATVESGTYDLTATKECYSEDIKTVTVIDSNLIQDFIIDCTEYEICPTCPPDKLDWWLLIVGATAGHLLKRSKKNDKR